MSINTYPLRSVAAVVKITPQPHTLAHSSAVLRKLTSFGRIDTFKKFNDSPFKDATKSPTERALENWSLNNEYRVLFADAAELSKAIAAGPFTVNVDHDIPDAKEVDPFNLTGIYSRKKPTPASYTCVVMHDHDAAAHLNMTTKSPFHAEFKTYKDSALYQSLLESRAPLGFVRGIAGVPSDAQRTPPTRSKSQSTHVNRNEAARTRSPTAPPLFSGPSPKLMDMYRKGAEQRKNKKNVIVNRLIPPPIPLQ